MELLSYNIPYQSGEVLGLDAREWWLVHRDVNDSTSTSPTSPSAAPAASLASPTTRHLLQGDAKQNGNVKTDGT